MKVWVWEGKAEDLERQAQGIGLNEVVGGTDGVSGVPSQTGAMHNPVCFVSGGSDRQERGGGRDREGLREEGRGNGGDR